jgi:hypothetical protein
MDNQIEHIEQAVEYVEDIKNIKNKKDNIDHMTHSKSLKGFDTIKSIISFIIYPRDFFLLKNKYFDIYDSITYSDFRKWNYHCIKNLNKDQCKTLSKICKEISLQTFLWMNSDTYTISEPGGFYYDHNGYLKVINPR